MVAVEASKLSLSSPPSSEAPVAVLFEPTSLSLALTRADSSVSLFPSLPSPLSLPHPSLPLPQTLVPPPSSASASLFLLLRRDSVSAPIVLFIVSCPHRGGSQILLRFYALLPGSAKFTKPQVVCNHKGLAFEHNSGVSVDARHGFAVKLSGSVNFFSMYSISSSKVWVFAVKAAQDEGTGDGGLVLKLMKCAVIECCRPLWSICVAFGLVVLGEENGVRVFDLRSVGKGHSQKVRNMVSNHDRGSRMPNGVISSGASRQSDNASHCRLEGKSDKHCGSIKQKSLKLKQDGDSGQAFYVEFEKDDNLAAKAPSMQALSLKALSIQALSSVAYIVLDSLGDLHLLCLLKSNTISSTKFEICLKRLPHIMKVRHLAVLPDSSMRAETVWVSDGNYSVHVISGLDIDVTDGENDIDEKIRQISVRQAIFTSEKIHALMPLSPNGALILGQGSIYAYSIS